MPEHDRREAVVAARGVARRSRGRPACRSTRGRGRARRSAASRSACRRTRPGGCSSAWRSADRRRRPCVPSASSPDASIGAPASLRAPRADGVEVLEREAERVHHLVAARARRVRAVLLHPLAHRQRLAALARFSSSGGTFGGGGGGGVPSMFSSIHLPRSTGDVRSAYDVTVRMLPWPSRPARVVGRA